MVGNPAILLFPIWDKDTIIFLVFMAGMSGIYMVIYKIIDTIGVQLCRIYNPTRLNISICNAEINDICTDITIAK